MGWNVLRQGCVLLAFCVVWVGTGRWRVSGCGYIEQLGPGPACLPVVLSSLWSKKVMSFNLGLSFTKGPYILPLFQSHILVLSFCLTKTIQPREIRKFACICTQEYTHNPANRWQSQPTHILTV